MDVSVALMFALLLSIIVNFALSDRLQEAEGSNDELVTENVELREKLGELMVRKSIRCNIAEIMEGEENANC